MKLITHLVMLQTYNLYVKILTDNYWPNFNNWLNKKNYLNWLTKAPNIWDVVLWLWSATIRSYTIKLFVTLLMHAPTWICLYYMILLNLVVKVAEILTIACHHFALLISFWCLQSPLSFAPSRLLILSNKRIAKEL